MTETEIENLFRSFENKKVLIIGDSMVDAYMWGKIKRMSPEAPVPIVDIDKHESRLGGAANVARNIKSLGASAILCTIIGNDTRGEQFKKLMKEEGLSTQGVIISDKRKTTVKTRIISDQKHQLRVDEEDTRPITIEEEFINLIDKLLEKINVIIFQDYNKGVLTTKIIRTIIKKANKLNIPTIVDPKKKNFNIYKECSIFKPNLIEIQEGMNIRLNASNINDLKDTSTLLRRKLNAKAILLTLSEKGICINSKNNFSHTPAYKCNVIDVSGAGDTVISVASLLLSEKVDYTNLSKISALAGGIVCEKVGVVPINKKILLKETKKYI